MSELRPCDDSRVAGSNVTLRAAGVLAADGKIRMPLAAYEPGYGIIQENGIVGQGVAVTSIGVTHYIAADAHLPGAKVGVRDVNGRLGIVPAGQPYLMIALKPVTAQDDIGLGLVQPGVMGRDIRVIATAKTANFSLAAAFPEAGTYLIHAIVIIETAGNAVTGGINIGTANGGAQVVSAQAVGANAQVTAVLAKAVHVVSAAQTLFVAAHTAWNDASINLFFLAERLD